MAGWRVELRAGADGPLLWDDRGAVYGTAEEAVDSGRDLIAMLVPQPYLIHRVGVYVPWVLPELVFRDRDTESDPKPNPETCREVFEEFVFNTAWEAHQKACQMIADAVAVPIEVVDG